MRVSVVMAAYNAEPYIAEAIESVLGQSQPPQEFFVVAGPSTDNTSKVIDRYIGRVTSVFEARRSQTAAINRGDFISRVGVLSA